MGLNISKAITNKRYLCQNNDYDYNEHKYINDEKMKNMNLSFRERRNLPPLKISIGNDDEIDDFNNVKRFNMTKYKSNDCLRQFFEVNKIYSVKSA